MRDHEIEEQVFRRNMSADVFPLMHAFLRNARTPTPTPITPEFMAEIELAASTATTLWAYCSAFQSIARAAQKMGLPIT